MKHLARSQSLAVHAAEELSAGFGSTAATPVGIVATAKAVECTAVPHLAADTSSTSGVGRKDHNLGTSTSAVPGVLDEPGHERLADSCNSSPNDLAVHTWRI